MHLVSHETMMQIVFLPNFLIFVPPPRISVTHFASPRVPLGARDFDGIKWQSNRYAAGHPCEAPPRRASSVYWDGGHFQRAYRARDCRNGDSPYSAAAAGGGAAFSTPSSTVSSAASTGVYISSTYLIDSRLCNTQTRQLTDGVKTTTVGSKKTAR